MATIKLDQRAVLNEKDFSNNHIDIKAPRRLEIRPKGTGVIITDFEVHMEPDEVGIIQQQHNLSSKYLLVLASTIVKSDHKGKLTVTLINLGDILAEIDPNEAVAQLLILKSGSLKIER